MRVKSILSSAIVISILLIQPTSAASPRYEIIDLGGEEAYSINEEGEVVGRAFYHAMPQGVHHAVLFDTTGGGNNIDLGTLAEGTHSCAWSINNRSQIVGYASTYGIHSMHATLFDSSGNGNNTDFLTLGGMESAARSINDGGQIIGYATNNLNMERATLFDPSGSGENIDLGTLGGDVSEAMSINNNGQIVGWAMDSLGFKIATIFDPTGNGDNLDLGTLGGNYSFALSINDKGKIVGSADIASGDTHATLFDTSGNGNNVDLGTLGGNSSAALSINNKAQIVGISRTTYSYYKHAYHATLFDPSGNGNNIDLNALIDPNSGWILKEALSINDYRWIVGVGYNPEGRATACLLIPKPPKIIYVDDDANGSNDGSSWADAFNYLQDALTAAWIGDEIQVAQGIYTPDSNSADPNGSGDRTATFHLINGVTIKGGYAGAGTPDPNARDIQLYETILSGDLNGYDVDVSDPCDLLTEPTRAENSYNVVTGSGTDASAILDGFTITGGNANGPVEWPFVHRRGGGMYNESGSPILTNCTLRKNSSAWGGGGTYNRGYEGVCKPIFTNCTFTENWADGGGGMENRHSSAILTNCMFSCNSAGYGGGGMQAGFADVLINCTFRGNSAVAGGGMDNDSGSTILIDCTFTGNSATRWGGAMFNEESNPTLTNCTLSGNFAGEWRGGGGMYNYKAEPTLSNCILTGNVNAAIVDGTYASNMIFTITNCTFTGNDCAIDPGASAIVTITNSILWNGGNEHEIGFHDPYIVVIAYSDVQGGWWGNIDAYPCFADPGYWDANGVWIEGDYHLLPDSPCIDAGDPNYIAEPNETDLDGRPRVINGRIDMGAYEYSPPIQVDVRIVPRTMNLTSKGNWITCYICLPEDYNVADIDPNSIFLENEIEPERFWLTEDNQTAIAKFNREEVQNILSVGDIELTITGRLEDGTTFEGGDIIKVTDAAGKKPANGR